MRKLYALLLLPVLMFTAFQLNAQACDPNQELPDSIIVDPLPYQEDFPDRGIPDTACVNNYFETVIQIQVPNSVTFMGTELTIDSVIVEQIGALQNIPAEFSYICNPPSCVFLPDTVGCVVLYGTAAPGSEDVYDMKIEALVATNFLDITIDLPDDNLAPGNYFLHVRGEDGPNCTVISDVVDFGDQAGFELSIAPNPADAFAVLDVALEESGRYNLGIYDLLGQKVLTRTLELVAGENQVNIDAANLPAGMYVFTLDDGQKGASGRLVVQR